MFPFSVIGTIDLPDTRVQDPVEVAMAIERKLAPAPWHAERQDNRLHFEGGVYSQSAPGWRSLFNFVGMCWLEVLSEPRPTLAYKLSTGEMSWLAFAVAVGAGVLIEAIWRTPVVAVIVAVVIAAGVSTVGYFYEARRVREFLEGVLAE